ncbi:VanZ family protein [Methylomonas sp. 2BW1-5-20]|uniref:VanZ family protein n=1 Tax=Methylomonas sp. 2BW1-5-20 TaxID=3376686 RepID=UPI004050E45C
MLAEHSLPQRQVLLLKGFGFCMLYDLSDEWHWSSVAGRHSYALDWLVDSVGGLAGGTKYIKSS